ncbi:MAG: retroviral-like aspartic protease [Chloroflexi bacterium]|nr:MAG: retroviral-like aspartic protease [Chloroflexota bacterium]
MLPEAQRFPFLEAGGPLGAAGALPYLPLTLGHQDVSLSALGLLDTGATVNVLPYEIGRKLGAVWEQQTVSVRLTGNLARFEARVLIVSAVVGRFAPVRLAFAWTQARKVPLILGQVNFFLEFDVCFFRSQGMFEVRPRK